MEYQVVWGGDPEDLMVTTSGDASVDELHEWVQEALADPRFRHNLRILIDHRQTRWWALSNDEIRRRASLVAADRQRIGPQRIAAVVGSPIDDALGAMIRSLIEGRVEFELEIFDTLEAARAWLRLQPVERSTV